VTEVAAVDRPILDDATADDLRWMDVALDLGRRGLGLTAPNPPVGAVIVASGRGGRVVGRGWTRPGGRPHAETEALQRAGDAARGATAYVTLEPCSHFGQTPPCVDALLAAGVARVVAGLRDPDPRVDGRGVARLRAAGVSVTVAPSAEARRLAAGHIARVTLGRPHVALKLAVSVDGKVGLAGRKPAAISGDASRRRVHLMRAESDAILVGIGTVLADDPALTCRLPGMGSRSPTRVVLDTELRTPLTSVLVRTARETPTWIFCAEEASTEAERALKAAGVEVMRVDRAAAGRLDLGKAMKLLALRGLTRVMVEGGPTVAAALLEADLLDEATIVTGPAILGASAIDALEGKPLSALTAAPGFRLTAESRVGDDSWARYERS
jgi:diaminohydroxyphosphoribosylaminopyrimidine deaminase/5-amino-6-(5-phosphoribosylamino)uracil reductase